MEDCCRREWHARGLKSRSNVVWLRQIMFTYQSLLLNFRNQPSLKSLSFSTATHSKVEAWYAHSPTKILWRLKTHHWVLDKLLQKKLQSLQQRNGRLRRLTLKKTMSLANPSRRNKIKMKSRMRMLRMQRMPRILKMLMSEKMAKDRILWDNFSSFMYPRFDSRSNSLNKPW